MSRRLKLLAGALVVAVLVAAGFAGAALAAGPQGGTTNANNGGQYGWGYCQGLGLPVSLEAISELLGLSPDEIIAQRQEGKSLVEIAAAQGVDEATLTEAVLAARAEVLQQKVTDGILTQEQADLMLERMQEHVSYMLNNTTVGPSGGKQGACYGQPGQGTGPGQMRCWGYQGNNGTSNGQTGYGMMGRGGMMGGGMMGRGSW